MSVLVPPCKGCFVPGSDAMSSPTQRPDRHILEIEERGRECIGKKPLAITDARKSRRLSERYKRVIGDALKSPRWTIAAKRKWRLPSKPLNRMRELGQAQFIRLA